MNGAHSDVVKPWIELLETPRYSRSVLCHQCITKAGFLIVIVDDPDGAESHDVVIAKRTIAFEPSVRINCTGLINEEANPTAVLDIGSEMPRRLRIVQIDEARLLHIE